MRKNHFLAHKNAENINYQGRIRQRTSILGYRLEKNCILPTIFTKIENMIREMGTAGQRLSYIPIDWLLIGWIQRIIRKNMGLKVTGE